jgi:hypothetical protein
LGALANFLDEILVLDLGNFLDGIFFLVVGNLLDGIFFAMLWLLGAVVSLRVGFRVSELCLDERFVIHLWLHIFA